MFISYLLNHYSLYHQQLLKSYIALLFQIRAFLYAPSGNENRVHKTRLFFQHRAQEAFYRFDGSVCFNHDVETPSLVLE